MPRWLCALAWLTAVSAQAQHRPSTGCRLPIGPVLAESAPAKTEGRDRETCEAPSATFEVRFDGFPADAERAFDAAVETWACRIASDVPIRIDARWEPLGPAVLGSAGPFLTRNFSGAPARETWYPAALADALAGRDTGGDADIEASFNSDFGTWHLDPDTPPEPDAYDLYTVVLHELGHGLGFIGNLTVEDGLGYVGLPGETRGAFVYDRFTRGARGEVLTELGDGTPTLAEALQETVLFDGRLSRRVGGPTLLYAPRRWEPGGSYSHLDEETFERGSPDGLMTPFVGRGETVERPGPAVCAILADIGWTLAGACAASVGPVEPAGDVLALRSAGANPVRGGAIEIEVTAAVPQPARITLVDALGRRIASADGPVELEARRVQFPTRDLASGVYRVVAEAGGERRSLPVTVVR